MVWVEKRTRDVAFTLDRYGHLYEDHDEQALEWMDGVYATAQLTPGSHPAVVELDSRRLGKGP